MMAERTFRNQKTLLLLRVNRRQYKFLQTILAVKLILNSSFNFSCHCQFQLQLNFSCQKKIQFQLRLQLTEISHFHYYEFQL